MASIYVPIPTDEQPVSSSSDLKKKEKEQVTEIELRKREQEIKQKEEFAVEDISVLGERIISRDTANDLPIRLQKLQHSASITLIGIGSCLTYNLLAPSMALGITGEAYFKSWAIAIIYYVLGNLGSYLLLYRHLCHALRTGNTSNYEWFMLFYMIHIGFCIFAAVSPPIFSNGKSLTGFLSALDIWRHDSLAGEFYFFGSGLFWIEALMSIWVLQAT